MSNLILSNALTMSSREIAQLTNKEHKHVRRDIEKMFIDLKESLRGHAQKWTHPQNGQEYEEYLLDKDHVECLLTGYSAELRMRVIKRWHELESNRQSVITLPNFNNPAEAARAWADEVEKKQQLLLENKEQLQKIESLESLFQQGETIPQFCKKLNGVNVMQACSYLESRNWLYNESKSGVRWRVKSYARDKYLTEEGTVIDKQGQEPFIVNTPILLKNGAVKLYDYYLKGMLPMKKTWNGEYTQDKELRGAA